MVGRLRALNRELLMIINTILKSEGYRQNARERAWRTGSYGKRSLSGGHGIAC